MPYYGIIQTADIEEALRVARDELGKSRSSLPVHLKRIDFGEGGPDHAPVEYEVWAWRE